MPAIHATLVDETVIQVPAWVIDNASFLRWAESEEAPEKGKIGFIDGVMWIDDTMEQILHNLLKGVFTEAIRGWNRSHQLGTYFTDGMVYSSLEVEFSTVPDGIFVTKESIENGAVVFSPQSTVITGSPDMVLEIVSRSSVKKDFTKLRALYFEAGIREYWLVDSRVAEPVLQILKRGAKGYVECPNIEGWASSDVLQGSFKLKRDVVMNDFILEAKPPPDAKATLN